MDPTRQVTLTTVVAGGLAIAHAVATWPPEAVVALFGSGALIAFCAEAIVVARGWLTHHVTPRVAGVPLYTLLAWPTTVYVVYRFTLLVTAGWPAVVATAVLATIVDVLTDHTGVDRGLWTYTDAVPGPRYRGVPWWNYLGWLAITGVIAAGTRPFL
ncbi:MAG: carotenoid biosynthesis protein [Halobacteriaceae archaeon]